MENFLIGFYKKASFIEEPNEAAAAAGVGAVGLGAAKDSISNAVRDHKESKGLSSSKKNFAKKLKKGDILYTGYNPKDSYDVMLGKIKAPFKVSQMVQGATGNKNYHGMLYLGNGLVAQAEGKDQPLAIRKLTNELKGQRVKAYRPEGASKREIDSAINYAKKIKGTKYKSDVDVLKQGLRTVLDPTGGPKACRKTGKGVVCNTLITKAYPKQFPKEYSSINEVRKSKGVKFVGGLDKIKKSPLSDTLINRVGNPLLKNLKWLAPAAMAGYAASKIYSKNKEKDK